jgi:hypothetical protein
VTRYRRTGGVVTVGKGASPSTPGRQSGRLHPERTAAPAVALGIMNDWRFSRLPLPSFPAPLPARGSNDGHEPAIGGHRQPQSACRISSPAWARVNWHRPFPGADSAPPFVEDAFVVALPSLEARLGGEQAPDRRPQVEDREVGAGPDGEIVSVPYRISRGTSVDSGDVRVGERVVVERCVRVQVGRDALLDAVRQMKVGIVQLTVAGTLRQRTLSGGRHARGCQCARTAQAASVATRR